MIANHLNHLMIANDDQIQANYHGRPIVLYSVRCDRAVAYEGSSLCLNVFKVS